MTISPDLKALFRYTPYRPAAMTMYGTALEADAAAREGEAVQLRGTWCRAELTPTEDELRLELDNGQCLVIWLDTNHESDQSGTDDRVAAEVSDARSWPRVELLLRSESGREAVVLDEIHELMNRDASRDDWFSYFGLIDESLRHAYAELARTESQSDN